MQHRAALALATACYLLLQPVAVSAAHVDLAIGTILSPPNLQRGQEVPPGATIQSGADGLIVLSQSWPSNMAGFKCEAVTVVGYGKSYTVRDNAQPGQECRLTAILATPAPGQPILTEAIRYADAKTDTQPPPAVSASNQAWTRFERWMNQQNAAQAANPQTSKPHGATAGLTLARPAGMGPLENDRSYSGADYRDARVSTAAECSTICANEPQCMAMTYIPDQARCWLKSSVPPAQAAPGMISAVKLH